MSVQAVGWALVQRTGLDPTSKLVLLALAEGANRADDRVWLSRSSLAEIALRSSTRTVDRCIADLVRLGYVEPSDIDDLDDDRRAQYFVIPEHRRPRIWHVLTGAEIAPGGAQRAAPGGAQLPGAVRGATAAAHKPSDNQMTEPAPSTPAAAADYRAQSENVTQLRRALDPHRPDEATA